MNAAALPPGPDESSAASLLIAMRRDPLGFFTRLAADYGDIVHFKLGPESTYYFLNSPDLIKEVLVVQERNFTKWFAVDRIREVLGEGLFVSEGAFHMQQRRLSQPAFHGQRVAGYAATMVEMSIQLRERWHPGQTVDMCAEMNWLAMNIVARALFGANVDSDAEEVRIALGEILDQFEKSTLPEADRPDFERACARLDATIFRIIENRRKSGQDAGDLLSMLLRAGEEEQTRMTDRQIRDEVMTIFLAGHETTANALAWSWYLLSLHPQVEARFHEEVDRIPAGREPRMEDYPRLVYTEMIFAEALRLYPPLWAVGRRAVENCRVGGFDLPAGAIVIVSPYVTQRDPRFFPDPSRFDPDRWTAESRAARPKFSYFPFSAGSRSCLGESFAKAEGVLCLATLARRYRAMTLPSQRIALQPQLTLRAKYGIKMRLEQRICHTPAPA